MTVSLDDMDALFPPEQPATTAPDDDATQILDALDAANAAVTALTGRYDQVRAGQTAMIAGAPNDPVTLNQSLLSGDTRGGLQEMTEAHYQGQQAELQEYVNQSVLDAKTPAEDIAHTAYEEAVRIQGRAQHPAATEMAYMEAAAPKADSTMRDEMAFQMKAYNILQELAESQGWADDALDIAGSIVPLALTKDTSDAADLLNKDPELAAISGPDLETIAVNFQALDAATKELLFPRIVEIIKEATKTSVLGFESEGNVTQAIGLLQSMLSPEAGDVVAGQRFIDVGLSALDIPGGKALGTLGRIGKMGAKEQVQVGRVLRSATEKAVAENNPVSLAKRAGDEEAAASHAVAALNDPEVATSMNTTQLNAALSAMPVQTGQWFAGVTDELSSAMAQRLEQDLQRAQGFARSMTTERQMIQVGALTKSDRKVAIDNVMQQLERKGEDYLLQNMTMENLRVIDETDAGFTYEYTLRRHDVPPVQPVAVQAVDEAAPASTPVADTLVSSTRITKTKGGSTLIQGDPAAVRKVLTDAGLPPGAVNRVKGEDYVSLSGELYDQVVGAFAKDAGVELGKPTITAAEKVKARAAKAKAKQFQTDEAQAAAAIQSSVPQFEKVQGTVKFTVDQNTGNYVATTEHLAENRATSFITAPTTWSKGDAGIDFNQAVTDSIVSSDVGAAAQSYADDLLNWVLEPIAGVTGTKARKRLDAVLLHGDEYINEGSSITGRTFTPEELAAGFDLPGFSGKVTLTTPAEVQAYYRARMFADTMYQLENHAMRRSLELQGMRNVKIGNEFSVGRPYDTLAAADAALRQKPGYAIFKADTREVLDFNPQQMEKFYNDGYKLVNTKNSYNTSGGGVGDAVSPYVDYILVRDADITDLPAQVLHYRNGYVPKMNKVEFMVKMDTPITKPGEPGAMRNMAIRGFNSLENAKRFREEQVAKYLAANPGLSYEQASARFSIGGAEETNAFDAMEKGLGNSGGLYTGMRSQNEILYGLSGERMARVGALEAFQRQTSHVGVLYSRNEMRLGQEQKWLNTVRIKLPSVRVTSFANTALPDNAVGKALERMRMQIKEWNGIPEVEETRFQASMQYMHDWMLSGVRKLGFQSEGSYQSLQWLKHTNPITAIKATVMHTLLGAMNPAQLYTQASAALIAATRRAGVSLTGDVAGDLRTAFKFGMLDNIRDDGALSKALALMVRKQDIDPRVAEAYQAYRRTGLYESALNNADTSKLSVDGLGWAMSTMRKLDSVSLVFYRAGELFNRRYSFIKEFAAWRHAHPNAALDEDALIGITKEANKNMLELNAANRAYWQGGQGTNAFRQVAGMATQFLQVTTKTAELLLPAVITGRSEKAGFTQAQKGRILGGQLFLFGAAGLPLGNMAVNGIMQLAGAENASDETALALNQGFAGWAVNHMLGLEESDQQLDISQRVALGTQLTEFFRGVMSSDDPIVYAALGPFGGTTGVRMLDAFRELRIMWLGSRAGTEELSMEDMKMAVHTIASVTSTGNYLTKAWMMHNQGKILDRRRNVVAEREFELGTEMGVAFGFRPTLETSTRMIQVANRKFDELVLDQADVRVKLMHKAIFDYRMDGKKVAEIERAFQLMDESIDNPMLLQAIRNEVDRRVWQAPTSVEERAISDWWKRVGVDRVSQHAILDRGVGIEAEQAVIRPLNSVMNEE